MKIGELFVNLGIKGSEKTVGAVTAVKKGLGETASMSLEAKAGILAAMYALERLFAASGAAGTGLMNFNALTGLSVRQLQQWQFAARQAGVSSEEFAGSVKSVQTSMTNMLLGKGAPEGLAMLANKVGFDPKRARDTFYVLEQLQKFARTVPNDIGNSVIKSFGVSDGTIAAMRRNAFTPAVMAKAPTYSDNEIGALDRANIAWSNLGTKIEMAVGRFNAKHGGQLVNDISQVTDKVLSLVEAFTRLSEKLKLFQLLGKAFEGWTHIFGLAAEGVDAVSGAGSDQGKQKQLAENVLGFFKDMPNVFRAMAEDFSQPQLEPALATAPAQSGVAQKVKEKKEARRFGDIPQPKTVLKMPSPKSSGIPAAAKFITPKLPALAPKSGSTQNINVNQNLNFQHEGKDAKQTSDSIKKATQDAYRQFSQGQVN